MASLTTTSLLPPPISADYYDKEFAAAINALEPAEMDATEKINVEVLRNKIYEAVGFGSENIPDDLFPLFSKARMLQFGRARKWNYKKSTEMFVNMLTWYRTYDLPQQMARWEMVDAKGRSGAIFRRYMCLGGFGKDKRGVPVMYIRPGTDIKGLVREIGYEAYERGSLHQLWCLGRELEKTSLAFGKHLVCGSVVFDYSDFSWSMTYSNIKPFGKHVKIQDDNFPERLYTCLICRAPWVFSGIWRLFKPFLSVDTCAKVKILGRSSNHLEALTEMIDISQIPVFLGGELHGWPYGKGGVIPVGALGDEGEEGVAGVVGGEGGEGEDGKEGDESEEQGETKSAGPKMNRRKSTSMKGLHVSSVKTITCSLKKGETMLLQWQVVEYDIDFTAATTDGKTLKATKRISSDSDGLQILEHTASTGDCKVVLTFDNSFSYLREKDITYELHVIADVVE